MVNFGIRGLFSGIGATISESYPNDVRATGYGVSYNAGRVIGSFFPLSVGWLSSDGTSLPLAIAMVAFTLTYMPVMGYLAGKGAKNSVEAVRGFALKQR